MGIARAWVLPARHPALAGHFPGKPIVPAVVLLEAVVRVVAEELAGIEVTGFPIAKFLVPLPPDQPITIRLEGCGEGRLAFACVRDEDGALVAHGTLATRVKPPSSP